MAHTLNFHCTKLQTMKKLKAILQKGTQMTEDSKSNECTDPTQNFTVELPCQMVDRIERYAKENETTVEGVLIETLDNFLRR
jgi:hypothetical protein